MERMKIYPKAWREGGEEERKGGGKKEDYLGNREGGKEEERIIHFSVLYTFFLIFVYFKGERERGSQRGRERIPSRLHAVSSQSLTPGSNPWTVRSWSEPQSRVGRLTNLATQVPYYIHYCWLKVNTYFMYRNSIKRLISASHNTWTNWQYNKYNKIMSDSIQERSWLNNVLFQQQFHFSY